MSREFRKALNDSVIRMFNRGKTYGEIAARYGLNRNQVAGIINRNRTTPADPVKAAYRRGFTDQMLFGENDQ